MAYTQAQRILNEYKVRPPFIHKGFHARFYPIDFVQLIWNTWGDYEGYPYRLHISALHDEYWDLYYIPEEFTALREHYLARIAKDKNYLKTHYADWQQSCKRLDKRIEALEKAFAKSFSTILAEYKAFVDEYLFEYALAAPVQEACGFQPEQWINPEIEAYCTQHGLDFQQTAALLVAPVNHSFVSQEELDLLKGTEKTLAAHQQKWFWLQNNYADIKVLPLQFFKERFTELHKLAPQERAQRMSQLSNSPELARKAKETLFAKHKPSGTLQLYVTIAELFAEMQDVRKSFVLRANHYHLLFLEAVSQEYSQPLESLWFYTYHEMLKAIENTQFIPAQEIARRKKMVVEVASKKEQLVLSGDEAQLFFNQLQEKTAEAKEFKGTIAQAGKVQGTVKVVLKSNDIAKVQAGDILVASMTRPEMTPAMHKAAGYVTDEGGITSHAAIVARELKKPCIIGTRIATKVLKDGDRVEIDAKRGIVRKLL